VLEGEAGFAKDSRLGGLCQARLATQGRLCKLKWEPPRDCGTVLYSRSGIITCGGWPKASRRMTNDFCEDEVAKNLLYKELALSIAKHLLKFRE